jgi:hypothetical protein
VGPSGRSPDGTIDMTDPVLFTAEMSSRQH